MNKKVFIFLCIIFLFCMCNISFALTTLHETSETQVLNSGTKLINYKRLTDKGWLNVNIVDVDLEDKYTELELLTSENGLQTFQTVKAMALASRNCIAAINADFFTGNYKKGNAMGMSIRDGELLTSTYYENEVKDTFANFVQTEDNEVIMDYFTNKIILTDLSNDVAVQISEINKWQSDYSYPALYTSEWGEKSPELLLVKLVVRDNKIIDITNDEKAIEIPEDGFVICASDAPAQTILDNFKKGDKIKLENDIDLDIEKVNVAVSGGTILVENGVIPNFTHNITGSNPRTAIGISKDKKHVYLITVDGRQARSIGVTQTELAEFLIDKNIYFAMNLDGGGSTTMIARELGDADYTIENLPSDGSLRNVPNSVAVLNTSKTGSLDKLIIEVDTVNVFVGCKMELEVKGYDKYYNPVEIDKDKIKWTYSGVPVEIKNNVLTGGDTAGTSTITAAIGNAKGSISIDVLSQPNELTISPKKITIGKGDSVTFKVSGQNKNGYFADLKNSEVVWNIESGKGKLNDGSFTANEAGDYIISVSAGNAKSYALVTVDESISKIINDFEHENYTFKCYPDEVLGKVETTSEEIFNGEYSAKLTYDFTTTTKTRAAYLNFNESITLDNSAVSVEFKLYATSSTSDQIKAKIIDANGAVQYLLICKGLESSGWQEMHFDLNNIALPAKLTDLYVAQDNSETLTSGSVYFDDLKLNYKTSAENSSTIIPKDVKGADELNISSELENTNSFRIVVAPECKNETLLDHLANEKLENVINNNSEIVIIPAQNATKMLANASKTKICASGYSLMNYNRATIITLDISSGGLRMTDSNQWISLKKDIANGNKNVLIVMNGNIEDFVDEAEKSLFIDVLCELKRSTGKNIWVVQKGDNTDYSMKRGIKYLSVAPNLYEEPSIETIRNTNYIIITVNDNKMTYEIKNVFAK